MSAPFRVDPNARLAWSLTALGALVAARVVTDAPAWLLDPTAPVAPLCLALALASAAGAIFVHLRRAAGPLLATARLSLALLLAYAWRGEARELWAALVVYVALHDAERGLWPGAPLAPAAIALGLCLGWSAVEPGPAPARAVLLALVAAAAAAWGQHRAREALRPGGLGPPEERP